MIKAEFFYTSSKTLQREFRRFMKTAIINFAFKDETIRLEKGRFKKIKRKGK